MRATRVRLQHSPPHDFLRMGDVVARSDENQNRTFLLLTPRPLLTDVRSAARAMRAENLNVISVQYAEDTRMTAARKKIVEYYLTILVKDIVKFVNSVAPRVLSTRYTTRNCI